jgi:hypothetical protein
LLNVYFNHKYKQNYNNQSKGCGGLISVAGGGENVNAMILRCLIAELPQQD